VMISENLFVSSSVNLVRSRFPLLASFRSTVPFRISEAIFVYRVRGSGAQIVICY
jgi:hypothetical protein